MSARWVVDADNPRGHLVPMTPAEQAQYDADQTAGAAQAQQQAGLAANEQTMRKSLHDRMQQALDLADALDANTATPAQQRAALALCLRGVVRLARLVNEELEAVA